MKAETFLGIIVVITATTLLIFGHSSTIIWKYELCSWITGLLFVLLYNLEIFRPQNSKFNFVIGLVTAVFLGQYKMMDYYPVVIAIMIITPVLLCLMTAYVPVVAYRLAYRTVNRPVFPSKTIILFSWAVIEMTLI